MSYCEGKFFGKEEEEESEIRKFILFAYYIYPSPFLLSKALVVLKELICTASLLLHTYKQRTKSKQLLERNF